MMKFPIIENAKRQARMVFKGIAIPTMVPVPDCRVIDGVDYVSGVQDHGRYVVSEKVLKFNRKSLKNLGKVKKENNDPRFVGGEDSMIVKAGKPGSRERVEALAHQYTAILACGEEVSPFAWKE
jgi:hypothetical protein